MTGLQQPGDGVDADPGLFPPGTLAAPASGLSVGFTGTQHGMTRPQAVALYDHLAGLRRTHRGPRAFHHGDCVGADVQAAFCAMITGFEPIIAHPSNVESKRGFGIADQVRGPKPPLERNPDIVNESDELVACPKGMAEERRSGTWATVRYARRVGKPVTVIWPDGTFQRWGVDTSTVTW